MWAGPGRRGAWGALGVLAVVGLLAGVAAGPAAADWGGKPPNLSPGPYGETPQVAVDASGNVVVVWRDSTAPPYKSADEMLGTSIVRGARYSASSGSWGGVSDLSAAGWDAYHPQVAVDSSGNAVAVWYRSYGSNDIVQTARYSASSGLWGGVSDLSAASQNASGPQVAVDSFGNAVAVWFSSYGSNDIVQTARYSASSGSWGSVSDLSSAGESAEDPQVAVDASGNAIAVWVRSNGSNDIVQTARYTASSGSWGSVSDLSATGKDADVPQVAVDASGNAAAVWVRRNGVDTTVQAARYSASSGSWGSVFDLSGWGHIADTPQVAVDAFGNAIAVWTSTNEVYTVVQAARYTVSSGSWGSVSDLSAAEGHAEAPQVAVDASGDAVAVWAHVNVARSDTVVQAAGYTALSGSWGSVFDLSAAEGHAEEPQVAFDPFGDAVAVWKRGGRVQALLSSSSSSSSPWDDSVVYVALLAVALVLLVVRRHRRRGDAR